MDVTEAAEHLGVSPSMVRRYIERGLLPAHRFGARAWMIERAVLLAFRRPHWGWPKGKRRTPPKEGTDGA